VVRLQQVSPDQLKPPLLPLLPLLLRAHQAQGLSNQSVSPALLLLLLLLNLVPGLPDWWVNLVVLLQLGSWL
jgi:hypothetical protein